MSAFGERMSYLGETVASAMSTLCHPRRFRFGDFALAFQRAACDGLPVCTGMGFLLGLILAFESAAAFRTFGLHSYVASLLAIGLFRELGPIITAIVLAGRSGSAFAAEIGAMKTDDELDALSTMGLAPVAFLVMPRVAAAALAMPVLTIFAELAGLAGGALVLAAMDVPPVVFWSNVVSASSAFIIALGLAKSVLFGAMVGLIGCIAGLRTRMSADGVGVSTTAAVVGGIVSVAVADGVMAVLCHIWNL